MKIPILVYHYFGETRQTQTGIKDEDRAFITPISLLRDHLMWLRENGFAGISFDTLLRSRVNQEALPVKPVIITIDDGHRSVGDFAAELLREFRFPAELFVVPSWVGKPGYLNWQELRELGTVDISSQSHGLSHRLLCRLSTIEIEEELANSKSQVEDHTGVAVSSLAVPMGGYPPSMRKVALATGYRAVCTSYYGLATYGGDVFKLPRIMMRYPYDTVDTLEKLINEDFMATLPLRTRNVVKSIKNRLIGVTAIGR